MARFKYTAIDHSGKRIKGSLEAPSVSGAVRAIKDMGLFPVDVSEGKESRFSLRIKREGLSKKELLIFSESLSSLIRSGLTMDRALRLIADSSTSPRLSRFSSDLLADIGKGLSLSEALEKRGVRGMFPALVKAGEMGGNVEGVLEKLSSYIKDELELRSSMISASIYPAILTGVGILSFVLILVVVIPRFSRIFVELGGKAPAPTRVLLAVSDIVRAVWWVPPVLAVILLLVGKKLVSTEGGRKKWEMRVLSMPVLGNFLKLREVSRIARAMQVLLEGGVSLVRAMELSEGVSPFIVFREEMLRFSSEIGKGKSVSQLFASSKLFPPYVSQMVAVGEETGELSRSFRIVAESYEKEIKSSMDRFISLFEPAMILFMGFLVGGMVISILMGIFSMTDITF